MALIGSGTYKTIPNVYTAGKFDAAQIDQGFGAIVDQVGGTSWESGAPVTRPGNLDENNFSTTPGFSNANKMAAYAAYYLNVYINAPRDTVNAVTVSYHHVAVVPVPMLIDQMSIIWKTPNGVVKENIKIDLVVNGNRDNPALRWYPELSTSETSLVNGVKMPATYSGTTYYVARSALEGPVQLSPGNVLMIGFPDPTTIGEVTISFACRVLHQP